MMSISKATLAVVLLAGAAPTLAAAQPLHRHKVHRHVVRTYNHSPRDAYYAGYARPPYGDAYDTGGPYGPNSADTSPLTAADDPYNPYAPPGAAIRAMARRNQFAPGVTNELAPDNIATATGGPSGGVPGFSSH